MKRVSKINYKELNDRKRFANGDLISETSDELNIPDSIVSLVIEVQSKTTAMTIRSGALEGITMVYLGKFKVNPRQVQLMMGKSMKG